MTAEYIVKIKGDTSQLEQTLKKVQGNMKKLDDDEVLIKLNYDGNVKQFNKVFDQVLKSCPELSIQFQYDVNKKILDSELEKMQKMTNLEYDINTSNVNKKIKKMIEDLDEAISLDASEAEIKQQIENIYKYANTAKQAGAKIGNDISEQIYNSIEGTDFEDLFEHISDRADRFKLFNISGSLSDEIDKTKSSIEDLKKYTSDLESKGASPFGNTDLLVQLQNEIRIIKEDITELREQTNADSGKMFSEMSAQIQDLNDKLTETLDRMTRLQNPQEFNLGNTIKKWQNKGLEDVERYTPFNSQTMESLSAELEGEYNHITGKLIRESIEQAKFYVDGFIHSHPEKFAAFSDDDLEVFFKLAESGIVHQVITSFEEAMSLDLSKVDNSKFSEILAKVKEEYAKIEQDLSTQFYNNYADQMKQIANLVVDDTLETAPAPYQEIFSSIKERINKLFTDSTVTDFKSYTENVEKIIRTSLTSSSLYQNQSPEGKDKLISQMGKVEEAILGTFENQIYEDTKDVLQQRFQKVLVDVFSDSSFLKEGVTSAIKVESIADFIDFSSIKEAAKDIVDTAKKATEDAQKSHSPSLVAEKLGEYWGEGYAKGILEHKDDVEQAVSTLVKIGELTTKDMLEDMKNILSDDQYSLLVEPIQNVITARQHSLESENEYLSESVANESSRRSVLYDEISRLEEDNSELAQENDNLRRLLTKEAREQDAVARFYNEFGTPSQALDKNVFANCRELLDYLGGSFKEMNEEAEDFSELKLNAKFFEILTEQLNLTKGELTVIKSDLEEISHFVPGGNFRHLHGDIQSNRYISEKIDRIDSIAKGAYTVTSEDIANAEHLLEFANEYNKKKSSESNAGDIAQLNQEEQKLLPMVIETNDAYEKRNEQLDHMRAIEHAFQATIGQTNEAKINRDVAETLEQRRKEQEKLNEAKKEEIVTTLPSSATKENTIAVEKEAEAMSEVKEEAGKASVSKEDFAKANAEVLQSIKESLSGLSDETELFKTLNNIINKFSSKGADERISTLANSLTKVRDALSGSINDNSFISALQKLSEQGENLKDLADVLKASRKQIEKAKDVINDSEELSQADRDALAYQLSQAEEYAKEQKRILAIEKEIEKERERGRKQLEAYNKEQEKLAQKALKSLDNEKKSYGNKADSLGTKLYKEILNGVGKYNKDLIEQWDNLKSQIEQFKINLDSTDLDKAKQKIKELEDNFTSLTSTATKKENKIASEDSLSKLNQKIEEFRAKNTNLGRELSKRLDEVIARKERLLTAGLSGNALEKELKDISNEFLNIKAAADKAGESGKSFGHKIIDSLTSANARFIANYLSIQDMIRYVKTLADTVRDVDSAITELCKVSDASATRLQQNFEQSAKTAKELGSSITDVINQTADWARLGYNVDEAEKLARVTTLFQTVGDNMTAETASEAMISTLKAYSISVDESERIVDQYNEIANNFAIDTAGLADSITRAGAALHAGGNALSESMGLVVAANDSLQDPSSVGQMLKTMSMRLRGASVADLEELGIDTTGMSQGTKSIVQQFKAMAGIDIMEGTNYKSTFQILDELHDKWADLTDAEHAALTEAVGGKRGGSVMSSLMENWDDAKAVVEKAEQSTGSAMKEQLNYAQSIQFSLDRLNASWQELQVDLLDSSAVKNIVDLGNQLVNIIDELISNKTALAGVLSLIAGGIATKKNVGGLKNTSPLLCLAA